MKVKGAVTKNPRGFELLDTSKQQWSKKARSRRWRGGCKRNRRGKQDFEA
jgi:hypothetical protein